jgi:hypothetical protein
MKKTVLVVSMILLITACGGSPAVAEPTVTDAALQAPPTAAVQSLDELADAPAADSPSGLPADFEIYYKTMVFIEGTAQLMSKFDLAAMSDESTGLLALVAIPGIMDDRVIATEESPLPESLAPAWSNALEARDGILQAFETLLMTANQDDFLAQLGDSLALASQAVVETESVAASDFGATAESIALANRAALTEMGEAYQTFASMGLLLQSQGEGGSD